MMTSKVIAHKWWENTINVCVFNFILKFRHSVNLTLIIYYFIFQCFHLNVHSVGNGSKHLYVELLLTGPLSVLVQCIDQSFCSTALTHTRPELRALKVQIAETIWIRVGQTEKQEPQNKGERNLHAGVSNSDILIL